MSLAPPIAAPAAIDASTKGAANKSPDGLTNEEARRLFDQFGPNSIPDTSSHPARMAIEKLWAPIPWMLEAAIVLQVVLGEYIEAGIIAVLLLFNAALGFLQESRAQKTLDAPEITTGAERLGPPQRDVEESPRRRISAGRHREAFGR